MLNIWFMANKSKSRQIKLEKPGKTSFHKFSGVFPLSSHGTIWTAKWVKLSAQLTKVSENAELQIPQLP